MIAGGLVNLLILLGILAIVAIAMWAILTQISFPEPLNRIVMIVLIVVAAVVGIYVLLSLRNGVKLVEFRPSVLVPVAEMVPGLRAAHQRLG